MRTSVAPPWVTGHRYRRALPSGHERTIRIAHQETKLIIGKNCIQHLPGQTTSKGDRTQPVRTTRRETHRLQESGRVANVRRPRYKSPDLSLSPTRHGNGQSSVWRCNTLHGHAALLLVQANHKEQRRDKSSNAARRCVTERLSPQSGRWLSPPISRAARPPKERFAGCGQVVDPSDRS